MPVFGVAPRPFVEGLPPHLSPIAGFVGQASRGPDPVETAFVFSGGGNRGACQVGMLRALCERGIMPRPPCRVLDWRRECGVLCRLSPPSRALTPAEMWRTVATKDVFPKGRLHGSWRFVERREAVYPIEGLRRLVQSFLRFERLEDSVVPLTVVVTRLDDGVEELVTEGPALEAVGSPPPPCRRSSRPLNGRAVVTSTGAWSTTRRCRWPWLPAHGGSTYCCAVGSSALSSSTSDLMRPCSSLSDRRSVLGFAGHLGAVPDDVDVVVLEQSGVEEILWQDFSHTEELLERGLSRCPRRPRPDRGANRREAWHAPWHKMVVPDERTPAAPEKKDPG